MTQALPISRLINVGVNLTPNAAQFQNISNALILGNSNIIDVTERYRTYFTIDAVATDFGTSAAEYLAAVLWFEQSPQPTQLLIGRWAKTATAAVLRGAAVSVANQLMTTWNAITTGSFSFVLNGRPITLTPQNFSAVANINAIAAQIQTVLAGIVTGTTVVWNSSFQRFEIQSGTTGTTSTITFLKAPVSEGNFSFAGQPANNDTITLNGTVVTFVTGVPTGNQVQIGGSLTATLSNLLTFLTASADVQLVKFNYYVVGSILYVTAVTPGIGGDSLTIAKSSVNITVSGATLANGGGADISAIMAATSTSSGAYIANGIDAETALQAATLFDTDFGQSWYALVVIGASNSDHQALGSFIEATNNKHIYGVTTQEGGTLVSTSTTDIGYLLKQLNLNRSVVQYSSSNAYAVVSLLSRILTTDYTGNNTVITLMYKQEPGIVAETLNSTQITNLEDKNVNVFVNYNNDTAIIERGTVASGLFLDMITGTDWLALDIQTTLYNLLYTTSTKIPQTDAGNHTLLTAIESRLSQAVTNGLLAAGVWTAGGFGALSQGDFLPKGFYAFAPPISTQSAADRSARRSVTFQIAAKLAGAIHTINVQINVNR